MDKNKCPKLKTQKKFYEKKNFFYRNKLKTFFLKMRAFSRKITFLHFFCKTRPITSKKTPILHFAKFFLVFFSSRKKRHHHSSESFKSAWGFLDCAKILQTEKKYQKIAFFYKTINGNHVLENASSFFPSWVSKGKITKFKIEP
jgi:hypothetical protein